MIFVPTSKLQLSQDFYLAICIMLDKITQVLETLEQENDIDYFL